MGQKSSKLYVGLDVHKESIDITIEPPRESRRLAGLSHAAMANSCCWRWYADSRSAGGTFPMGSSSRR